MADVMAQLAQIYANARERSLDAYEGFAALPENERNQILIPAAFSAIVLSVLLFHCCRKRCRRCCRSCGSCCGSMCCCLPCCNRPDGSAYVRLERSAKELSAQCRLALRCSLKVCWLQIPIPYVSLSCADDSEQQPPAGARAPPSSRSTSAYGYDAEAALHHSRSASPSRSKQSDEPVVTEVVALQIKGEWSGPLNVWLSGVDTLHPAGLRLRRAGDEPPPPQQQQARWTRLYGAEASSSGRRGGWFDDSDDEDDGGGGGAAGKVTLLTFREPVKLQAGYECQLSVQVESKPPRERDRAKTKPPQIIGAGETTLAVYDDPEAAAAGTYEATATYETGRPPALSTVARSPATQGDAPMASPRAPPHGVVSAGPRVACSPRVGVSPRPSPRYYNDHGYDDGCSPSVNSMGTAMHRMHHGGLSAN